MFTLCAAKKIIPERASVHTQEQLWQRDFCDGAKLRRADLLSGESHTGKLFVSPGYPVYTISKALKSLSPSSMSCRFQRQENSPRHVAMVAKFLDDNKPKIQLKVNSHCFKLHRS